MEENNEGSIVIGNENLDIDHDENENTGSNTVELNSNSRQVKGAGRVAYQRVPLRPTRQVEIIRPTVDHKETAVISEAAQRRVQNNRKQFIKKVYFLLCLQFSWTVIVTGIVQGVPVLKEGIKNTKGLVIASCVICVVLVIAIMFNKKLAKRVPYNYICIFLFCFFESYIVAFICAYYSGVTVLCAVLITMAVALSLTIYSWKTTLDFTVTRGILISITASLIVFGLLMIFFHNHYASLIFCEIVVILYSIIIVYDTQLIAGGRYADISFDDYVIGSLILFVDIVGLFVYILALCFDKT